MTKKNKLLMGQWILDDTVSLKLAVQGHEAFSKLLRQLRALDLPYGLTDERLSALATVEAQEPIALSGLAETATVSLPTLSRMVAKLEAEGLVKRRQDKHGTRDILVSTTAKGREANQRATQQSLSHLLGAFSALEPEQLAAVRTLLSILDGPELFERAREAEHLYAIAPIGLCYFDTVLRYRYVNEWLARIHGLSVEAHVGKTIEEVIPAVAVRVGPQLRQVLQSGEPIVEAEVEVETPAHPGESRRYRHSYYPDKREDGMVVGVSCVVYDITERI